MQYPIYIDGAESGVLTVTQEGIRTRIKAQCAKTQKVTRLSVFGGGMSANLGVLRPAGDVMLFEKCFTKNEMRAFPEKIEYAANCELKKEEPPHIEREEKPEKTDELTWIMSTNGCLVTRDGGQTLVAIPADGKRLKNTGLVRRICGGDYLVFRR